jgi:hypothetical protein
MLPGGPWRVCEVNWFDGDLRRGQRLFHVDLWTG